jgi:flavin-dependent dehydrogenase
MASPHPPMSSPEVLVIGAGPAGSAAATVLARHGRRVLLVEKERFPRYRIGESLIPHCWFALERMGVIEKLERSGCAVHKHSVQFASVDGRVSRPYYFFQHDDHPSSRTWQVVRSEFDQLLLDHARETGVMVREGLAAEALLTEGSRTVGARLRDAEGTPLELRAQVTIDATGRDGLAQRERRWRVQDERLRKVAIWTYYDGAKRDPGLDAGATTIAYLPEKGWFWYIPLRRDRVSVGVVAEPDYLFGEERDPARIFEREVGRQRWIADHLAPGRPTGEFRVTRDYTSRSRHCADDGLVLVGDAFAFLDPVFSSGVFLALTSGVMAADAVHAALEAGDVSGASFDGYGQKLIGGMEAMRLLVHAFYDTGFHFSAFLRDHPEHRGDVTDVLTGNLFRDFGDFFRHMADYARLPEPLPHGRAAVS